MNCIPCPKGDICPLREADGSLRIPERLVGIGFRCWMAGFATCDINCWEAGWRIYRDRLGADAAKGAITELSCWVRALSAAANRRIEFYPFYDPFDGVAFCRDERLGIAMIAAGQHEAEDAVRGVAATLLGTPDADEVVRTARDFAAVLGAAGMTLEPRQSQ
ncbi:hypothetical protein [Rhodobium gokarnense]|uniref:Uncharacterized protein n=1 Tax=Rhodobium gokarnense TaxID=364296 RepID=A0ABT3HFD9_9HYPH|nr:hypothetical protein [Rhodobium gokarnense]MCW2309122.1 hypothetical protein [Rhodobium gokarnense]